MAELVVNTYASALFNFALEHNKLDPIKEELESLNKVFIDNAVFLKLLYSKALTKSYRKEALSGVFEGKISDNLFNFLRILIDNERIKYFPDICREYMGLYNEYHNIVEIKAVTAIPLRDEMKEKLALKLSKSMDKKIIIDNCVDTNLIGGMKLINGNKEIDASIIAKLRDINLMIHSLHVN